MRGGFPKGHHPLWRDNHPIDLVAAVTPTRAEESSCLANPEVGQELQASEILASPALNPTRDLNLWESDRAAVGKTCLLKP